MKPRIDVEISSSRIFELNVAYSLGMEPSDVGSEQVGGGGVVG